MSDSTTSDTSTTIDVISTLIGFTIVGFGIYFWASWVFETSAEAYNTGIQEALENAPRLKIERAAKAEVERIVAEKARIVADKIAKAAKIKAKKARISEVRKEIEKPSILRARISGGAAYLPDRFSYLMPELRNAIRIVAHRHEGCESISNASISENYTSKNTAAYFVTCKMSGKIFPYQNVFVKNGRIIATIP